MTKESANGCAIGGIVTVIVGIFIAGGIFGLATAILGALALKGDAWAKVLGIIELIVGTIFVVVPAIYISMI